MGNHVSFNWTLPEGVLGEDFKEAELQRRMQEGVVLSLFKEGKVSSGLGAEMLGISRQQFLRLLSDKGVPFFDLSEEDLQQEFQTVAELDEALGDENESPAP